MMAHRKEVWSQPSALIMLVVCYAVKVHRKRIVIRHFLNGGKHSQTGSALERFVSIVHSNGFVVGSGLTVVGSHRSG